MLFLPLLNFIAACFALGILLYQAVIFCHNFLFLPKYLWHTVSIQYPYSIHTVSVRFLPSAGRPSFGRQAFLRQAGLPSAGRPSFGRQAWFKMNNEK